MLLIHMARITPGLSRVSQSTIDLVPRSNLSLQLHAMSRWSVLATLLVIVTCVLAAKHAVVAVADPLSAQSHVNPDLEADAA